MNEGSQSKVFLQVITRNDRGIRGVLHATVVAFDKQWNLALSDVLEVWKRKGVKKRKIPPGMGELRKLKYALMLKKMFFFRTNYRLIWPHFCFLYFE